MGAQQTSILFLSADPTNVSRLRVQQELRDIETRLRLANARDAFVLHHRASIRPGDLTQAIFDTRPSIVHFSGHGSPAGALLLENDAGQIHPVTPEALESLFALCKDQVSCVLLNACYTQRQSRAIARHINHVIGMTQAIGDEAAIVFAVGFYKALAAGYPISQSFEFGRTELQLHNIPEHAVPVLIRQPTVKHLRLYKKDYWVQRKHYGSVEFPSEYVSFARLSFENDEPPSCILVNPDGYESVGDILDDIFINYLHKKVHVFSYGESWLLTLSDIGCRYPIIPYYWLTDYDNRRHHDRMAWSKRVDPRTVGLEPGRSCDIFLRGEGETPLREGYLMIACNNAVVHDLARSGIKNIALLMRILTKIQIDRFDEKNYRYKVLVSCVFNAEHGIFADSELSETDLAELRWYR